MIVNIIANIDAATPDRSDTCFLTRLDPSRAIKLDTSSRIDIALLDQFLAVCLLI